MPLYEYRCRKCKNSFEVIQKFSDPELTGCTKCGGKVEKVLSAPSIRFRGSGWYVNDYAGKSRNGSSGSADGSSESKSTEGSEKSDSGKSSESKPSATGGDKGKNKVA